MPQESHRITIGDYKIANDLPMVLIAGPCQMESRKHAIETAHAIKEISDKVGISLIYKTSFDKANRTSFQSERGIGFHAAMPIFEEIKDIFNIPIITDVHEIYQCQNASEAIDILQIPAFLCRQTDLLLSAAATGKAVNVKKGQFLAPWDMRHVASKLIDAGNSRVMLTERGTSFGYNTLVSDMRSLPIMASETGLPIIFDATHSVQQPGGLGASSGGQRQFVETLARAAVSVGVAGIFIEAHEDPDRAPSDGPNMIAIRDLEPLLRRLTALDMLQKSWN